MTRYLVDDIRYARSFLFVPGNRPERFAKAAAAGSDIVIIDLEDAVAAADKDAARDHAAQFLAAGGPAMVRMNAANTPWHEDDLALIGAHRPSVMLPKAAWPEEIRRITELAPDVPVVPLVETAAGVATVNALCAVVGVVRVAFGSIDLANELGVDPDDREALLLARSALVLGSAAAGLAPPIDGVTTALTDGDVVTDDFRYARRLGMGAKLCIHPSQIAAVHAAAMPSEADICWARKIIDAEGAATGSATASEGRMIDVPVIERARSILDAAERG